MELVTESKLRKLSKKNNLKYLEVSTDSIITPSARQYIRDKNIDLITKNNDSNSPVKNETQSDSKNKSQSNSQTKADIDQISKGRAKLNKSDNNFKYQSYYTGAYFEEKPEFMTQIFGEKVVYKDHPIIEFRGKIDSIQSEILKVMLVIEKTGLDGLYDDLNESLDILRDILAAEVRNEEFEFNKILGLTAAEIRERSHYPQKYYGINHILPDTQMGEILVNLNSLRSSVREVEIAAVKAFRQENKVKRTDIIKALNRMSSVFYVMMCKYQAEEYN